MGTETVVRSWDSYDAYLFDLDGTLLHCHDAVHYFGFCHALQLLSGRPLNLDGVVAHGNTDLGIIRDALSAAGYQEGQWRPRLADAVRAMEEYVLMRKDEMRVTAICGAKEVLEDLKTKQKILGVATGNLERIGSLKLELSGLHHYFTRGAFSDGMETRSAVFAKAVSELKASDRNLGRVCVVGDTPNDIQAAHENGMAALAVATGTYPASQLRAYRPEYLVASMLELLA